jgi:tRNA dimethylallyltransferase
MKASKPTLIVVAGPTASGKTDFAIELAQKFKTEIISADSRQLYKEISIGTAKPSPEKLNLIKHHFIDHCSIFDEYNTGLFETEAMQVITEIFKKNNIAIMAGGTGLYIKAICSGLDKLPKANPQLRLQLQTEMNEFGVDHLYSILQKIDLEGSRSIDPKNPLRIMRALEIINSTGKKLSELKTAKKVNRPFNIVKIIMDVDRPTLYQRINDRTLQMIKQGFVEEAKEMHPFKHINALNTVGYKELFQYFEGEYTYEEAIEKIQQHTRNYAKRQLTWFRNESDFIPHNVFNPSSLL